MCESRERHSLSGFQEPTANLRMPRGARVHVASLGALPCLSNETSSSFSAGAVRCMAHHDSRSRPDEKRTDCTHSFSDCGSSRDLRRADVHRGLSVTSRALGKQEIGRIAFVQTLSWFRTRYYYLFLHSYIAVPNLYLVTRKSLINFIELFVFPHLLPIATRIQIIEYIGILYFANIPTMSVLKSEPDRVMRNASHTRNTTDSFFVRRKKAEFVPATVNWCNLDEYIMITAVWREIEGCDFDEIKN